MLDFGFKTLTQYKHYISTTMQKNATATNLNNKTTSSPPQNQSIQKNVVNCSHF